MKRFELYRNDLPPGHIGATDNPNKKRAEGIVFSDGIVVIRWFDHRTFQSTSVWDSYEAFMAVHGHPEYGTFIKFID